MKYHWELSTDLSYIDFSLKFYEIGQIKGYFKKFNGKIVTGKDFNDPVINLQILTGSVSTLNDEWDQALISPGFLSANEFPFITFTSDRGCHLSVGRIQELTGIVQFKGYQRGLTLLVTSAVFKNNGKKMSAQFSLTTTLSLNEYGFEITGEIFNKEVRLSMTLVFNMDETAFLTEMS
ncbi:YceI family protein [Mucilaginibacter sp. cycad4]|uniref:YceI family protein n=1 Tax=Mucilaginibacter sp. cycad4 TaxID=3342096 RepID=UPI002AAAE9A0|nr:YceI family protein [Mucilaginibacter gossypii]WPU99128.1 YceI family protein [Mucilaginibacter gossypii]